VREQQVPIKRLVSGDPGRELAAILNILQHPRNKQRDSSAAKRFHQRRSRFLAEMVNGGDSAFVMQLRHKWSSNDTQEIEGTSPHPQDARIFLRILGQAS
jgi:hypothetical protein